MEFSQVYMGFDGLGSRDVGSRNPSSAVKMEDSQQQSQLPGVRNYHMSYNSSSAGNAVIGGNDGAFNAGGVSDASSIQPTAMVNDAGANTATVGPSDFSSNVGNNPAFFGDGGLPLRMSSMKKSAGNNNGSLLDGTISMSDISLVSPGNNASAYKMPVGIDSAAPKRMQNESHVGGGAGSPSLELGRSGALPVSGLSSPYVNSLQQPSDGRNDDSNRDGHSSSFVPPSAAYCHRGSEDFLAGSGARNDQAAADAFDPTRRHTITADMNSLRSQMPTTQMGEKRRSSYSPSETSPGPRKRSSTSTLDESPEEKRRRALERNRIAASKCRQKKKQWTQELEATARSASEQSRSLKLLVSQLKDEVLNLKNQLLAHQNCSCEGIRRYLSSEAQGIMSQVKQR
ncbi:transcription factor Atf21 [Schizosaccharomyces japonicus yFS275]|uniref:Transcription factor Atf21 n=1 Tax=Schizosaccharomyces japonicus (strain yFS275 / FY16936) TaxID=402676 RepID=B6JYR0_SCHJY|nr:transcription factor Atf21 [Schizosaccharomyces japonicus yFS275]EEB06678.1 transcription factor Atf21 [Schizosaccharomyces japonicus yFS275]